MPNMDDTRERKKVWSEERDSTARLPEPVLHDILSRLSNKEAAKTSVLSKIWLGAWSTLPFLSFDDSDIEFVDATLSRYKEQRIPLLDFSLEITKGNKKHEGHDLVSFIDRCVKMITVDNAGGLKNLRFIISFLSLEPQQDRFPLPRAVFAMKSLTTLSLYGCSLMDHAIKIQCFSLRVLHLHEVFVTSSVIHSFISSCRLIEDISLETCSGCSEVIQVKNLPKLTSLSISTAPNHRVHVHVEAPRLEYFAYQCDKSGEDDRLPFCLKLDASQNLKDLKLTRVRVPETFIMNYISKLPSLKCLQLVLCSGFERLNLSSNSISVLDLLKTDNLKEASIHTPNLGFLGLWYFSKPIPKFNLTSNFNRLLTSNIKLISCGVKDSWFHELRRFIASLESHPRHESIMDLENFGNRVEFNVQDLESIINHLREDDPILLPTPRVCSFRVQMQKAASHPDCIALVNGLLWSCHPEILFVDTSTVADLQFIDCLSEMLLNRNKVECCTSNSPPAKCWRHYLKDVKVECLNNTFIPLQVLVNGLYTPKDHHGINFHLEW